MSGPRVAVVGAGIIGAAIGWRLAQAGCTVTLVETHLPTVGASAYSAGILRRHHSLATDIELASRSLPLYQDFQRQVGGTAGYTPAGFLAIVDSVFTDSLNHNRSMLDAFMGTSTTLLSTEDLAVRYPDLKLVGDEVGLLEPDGGYGNAYQATISLRAAATGAGARVMTGVRVDDLQVSESGNWQLGTNIGRLEFDQVVLAAGAASGSVAALAEVSLELTPRRIGLAVIRSASGRAGQLPVCIDDPTGTYFVPRTDDTTAVGVRARPESHQIIPAEPLTATEIEEALTRGARRVPGFATGDLLGSQAACDGYTPDGRPLLGPVVGRPGLQLACGFSGGGFKVAPAVADLITESIVTGATPALLETYCAERFATGRPLRSETAYVHF